MVKTGRIQYPAEVDKEIDECADQQFATGQFFRSLYLFPLAVDSLQDHQSMGLHSHARFSGQEEILSVMAFHEQSSRMHAALPLKSHFC